MKKRRISVTTQAMIAISALVLGVNVLLGGLLLTRSKALMKTLINDRMLDIASISAKMLDGDTLARLTEDSVGTPEYREIYDTLRVFQDNTDLEYIYVVRDMGDGTFIFLIDPAEENPAEYGRPVVATDALRAAARGGSAVDEKPYEDDWGRFYSAYCPVFDSAGRVGGIVCVDFRADWYEEQATRYAGTVLLFSVLSLCVGGLFVFVFTSKWRARLRRLGGELDEMTESIDSLLLELGDEPPEKSAAATSVKVTGDEVSYLGARLDAARDVLRHYTERMHAQANSMITALAADYRSVYYIDLDTDEGVCYRAHSKLDNGLREGESFPFRATFTDYANRYVAPSDREEFLRFVSPEVIREELRDEPIVAHRYLVVRGGHESYEMLRMAGVRHIEDRTDHMIHAVGVGFTDVDRETREALAQRQALTDALALAEEANRAKTAFLSSMSHEIRTPMNAIIGLDSIALNDPGISEQTRERLEKIGGSAQHLLSLINDILDMSRIEAGHTGLRNEEFSLPELLEQVNTMVEGLCREKGLTYECRLIGEMGEYYVGDATKLRQVLLNILGNAVKFTPEGGVTFTVERTARYEGKTALRFTVADTGIGMDKAFLPKLFDAFSKEDASTTSRYGSTGLGMAITKSLVEIMNGRIEVESEKGVGTTFTVAVTLLDAESSAPRDGAEKAPKRRAELKGRRILLAEDMPINAEIMTEVLAMRGMETEHAENGRIATELFASHPPFWYDAVLMDMRMPEMDGLEAAAAIRAMDRPDAKAVPIIAMTANAFEEDVQRSLQAGMNAHLSKPVEPEHLYETLERLIRSEAAADEAPAKS